MSRPASSQPLNLSTRNDEDSNLTIPYRTVSSPDLLDIEDSFIEQLPNVTSPSNFAEVDSNESTDLLRREIIREMNRESISDVVSDYTSSIDTNPGQLPGNFSENSNSNSSLETLNLESNSSLETLNLEVNENSNVSNPISINDESSSASLPDAVSFKSKVGPEKLAGPPAKLRRISSPPKNDDLDGETCPICLDSWGNSGDHRLVALRCGHLFGSNCVERWLKAQTTKDRTCPTCKTKASNKDIRFIYARRLVAADTSEITTLQKQVETLQTEKSRTELELQKCKIAHRACLQQLDALRSTLMKSQGIRERVERSSWRFALEKNLEVCRESGCRVMTYNCRTYELYVSQKSTNSLFPGYGIRKVNCVDYKLGQFVNLHPKAIRDLTYSQPRDLLLSVGLDSTARIVERGIPSSTIQTGIPLWSCSWDYMRSNEFFVGGVGGVIHQYDVRNPNSFLQRLSTPGDRSTSPSVSLCSTEFGLLSCNLHSAWLWVVNGSGLWEPRALPVEGPFMSMSYDHESHRAVLASKPSGTNSERSKLSVCKFKASIPSGEILCEVEQTFPGSSRSTLMSRSAWVKCPGSSWLASHSESDSALLLHGIDGSKTISLPAAEAALDVCTVQLHGDTLLAALSQSRLRLYKAILTNS